MEKKSYTYGSKLAGMILHLFFTVILTIAVYLLASLISKNILQVTDIGTDDFFNSGYYTKCMEQKCSELTDYLHLLQKGNKRSAEDDKRYLQYTNEFKREDTNFCYWYKQNGVWYTNQPDSVEGKLEGILGNASISGVSLYTAGLADKVTADVKELLAGPGAVRATLKKHLA